MSTPRAVRSLFLSALALTVSVCSLSAQASFEQVARELGSPDAALRLRAARLLKEAAYPEAAVPLARLVTDADDRVKFEVIAAELNIFLGRKIVTRKRVALVIEVRDTIAAEAAFSAGPTALGSRRVPQEVLQALLLGARDPNPRVAIEALYAFGTLASSPGGRVRRDLLRTSGPEIAAMLGAPDPAFRFAAVRVLERVFATRFGDDPVDTTVGDAVITALNDKDRGLRIAAIQTLGVMRYERAAQSLTDLFQYYERGDLAEASLDALAQIAHGSSAPLFGAALTGKRASTKGIAVEGLARIGDRQTLAQIQTALAGERDEGVLLAGAFAAAKLGEGSLERLTEALGRPRLRDQARRYLMELAPGHAAGFARLAQDPDARVRADIADILGLARDPAALPIVESMATDRDPNVALAAERAVAWLRAS